MTGLLHSLIAGTPPGDPHDAVSAVYLLLWAYIIGSIALLFGVQRLRIYPLYAVKTAWVTLTILAFAWVVMMSLTTNQEFANRPAGVFGVIGRFPVAFGSTGVWTHIWWIPLVAWVPLWAAGGMAEPGTVRRRRLRGALAIISAVVFLPLAKLVIGYEHWAAYDNIVDNYRVAWSVARMGQYFFNSLLISLCAVGLVMALGSMLAYGLTRLRFRGRGWIMGVLIASMGIPGFLLVVPLFVMMKDWSLAGFSFMDSRTGLAVLYGALAIPFTTFLLSAFYRSLPGELAESAAMDGATPWQIFADIYFPLSLPGMATAAIFNFLSIWNEYNFALIFLTNPEFKTLPVGLYNLKVSQEYAVNWPAMFAGIVILCLPTFLIFVVLQEKIVAGLTVGAVKE